MQGFDIYFMGEMLPDADPAAVKQGVGKLFKVEGKTLERMFSGKPMRVKQAVDADKASRYRAAFREVGALVQIVPTGSPAPEPKPVVAAPTPEPQADEEIVIAAPPPAPDEEIVVTAPPPAADDEITFVETSPEAAGTMSLAEPGVTIDDHPPPAPADIDTSGLEALPPNSGTLEDCVVEKPPREIPDISHLKLVDD